MSAEELFAGHRALLFSVAYEILGSVADAEDVLQESYLRWREVDDIHRAHAELQERGARIVQPPTEMGPVWTMILDDTCGNLIQIIEQKA